MIHLCITSAGNFCSSMLRKSSKVASKLHLSSARMSSRLARRARALPEICFELVYTFPKGASGNCDHEFHAFPLVPLVPPYHSSPSSPSSPLTTRPPRPPPLPVPPLPVCLSVSVSPVQYCISYICTQKIHPSKTGGLGYSKPHFWASNPSHCMSLVFHSSLLFVFSL
jgi:hypothetical protein